MRCWNCIKKPFPFGYEMNPALFSTIKFSLAAVLLIYLIRNTFKMRQLIMFADNFRKTTNQYKPDPFPLTHSTVEELEDVERVPEKISFFIPIEELINGFGFNLTSKSFESLLRESSSSFVLYFVIFLQIAIAFSICYFLLGIPLFMLIFATSGVIFLLAII